MIQISKTARRLSISIFTFFILFPATALASFTDVPLDHQYINSITTLELDGIIKGYADGTYLPEKPITRAEFFKTVLQHVGYKPQEKIYETKYQDVPPGSWFAPYVKKASDLKIILYSSDFPNFYPSAPISRIDALRIILFLEGVPTPFDSSTELVFEDIQEKSSSAYLVKAAQNAGIFIPEENPYFYPVKNLTRGETAELLYRAQIYRETNAYTLSITPNNSNIYVPFYTTENDLMDNPKYAIFLNVWDKLNEEYINSNIINQDELVYGAISGMVESLDDPYTIFEKPETANEIKDNLEGNFEGIGIVIDNFNQDFLIVTVLKDSPAMKAGLKAGDIILKIDNTDTSSLTIDELLQLIKGPSGSTVKLLILRDGTEKSFSVTRDLITLETVILPTDSTEIPSSIGYIAIYQFTGGTASQFDALLTDTLAKNPKGIILDLRDNPGGYIDSAYDILGYFIPSGTTIAKIQLQGEIIPEKSGGTGKLAGFPLVVLVNDKTASSAEIVTAALQETDSATIIGQTTYGKGTVQEVNIYTDGSLFKLSIAKWLTPSGKDINQIGITPDIIVEPTKDDLLGITDSQLQRAISELQKKI